MKTHQGEICCKASSPGRWSCRNKCDGPLECCSGGSGPQSRKSGWNSVPEKRLQLVPLLRWRQTLMKTVWSSDPVMRGLSLPSTKRSSSTGHLSFKISTFSNVSNAISVRFETLHWPGLDFADGDVSKSLWSSVWHASPRLWTVTWGFHFTRNTFVKNTFVKIKKYLYHKKKYLCQKKEKSLVKKYVLKKARSPLCHLNRPIFMQQWEFYFKQFFSSF